MSTIEVGELLYDYTVKLTGIKEYGVSFASLMEGTVAPPPEGARFDASFEGESVGPKLRGKAYSWVNALQIWGTGTVDLTEQVVRIKGYAA